MITYFAISALVNALSSTGLVFYVLFTGHKKRINRYVSYYCFAVAAWSIPYVFWQISTDAESALFWVRTLMVGAVFTSLSFLHMVLVFLRLEKERLYKIVLIIFYLISFLWVYLDLFTSYFVVGIEPRLFFQFWPTPGPFYAPFLMAFAIHVLYASILLFKKYKTSTGSERTQTLLLLVGIFVAFVGGSTNFLLWYNIPIAPWGNALVTLYVILTVYSIMKYGFLNLKVVTAEIFTVVLLILSFVNVLLSNSSTELTFNIVSFLILGFFGLMLVRSVRLEVRRREELAQLAKTLEKANLRLKELDQQKTDFLSIAAHQLRTPLSIMKGFVELIQDGAYGKITKKTFNVLNEMDQSNERLVKLVDEFLDVTRIEQGRTKFSYDNHDINELINGVVKELTQRAKNKKLEIVWELNKEIKKVYMDEEKIRHVIFNFIDNAIKYSTKGKIKVFLEKDKKGIAVRVQDSGLGFGKIDQANFFQKFYRGKNVKGTNVNGTGLGLYVCRMFIETHGGEVWAESKGPGKGSEFGFWIPGKKR